MGGWWPEYSTPDTGVRTTRQFILACTQSSMRYCRAGTLVLSQQSELISHCGCWLAFFFLLTLPHIWWFCKVQGVVFVFVFWCRGNSIGILLHMAWFSVIPGNAVTS